MFLMGLGWVVILVVTLFMWRATYCGAMFELGFSGKISAAPWIGLVVSLALTWLLYWSWPFNITVAISS